MPDWLKPGIFGGVVGAIAITIVGFSAGWIVTAGTASERATEQAQTAVSDALAPLCVDEFEAESTSQREDALAALDDASSWEEADVVLEQGWMEGLGTDENREDIAEICATRVIELAEGSSE